MNVGPHAQVLPVREVYARVRRLSGTAVCQRVGHGFLLERRRPAETGRRPTFGTMALTKEDLEASYEPMRRERKVIVLPAAGPPPTPEWVTIGRAKNTVVRLEHPSVSKLHALLRLVEAGFCLSDAGSKNGTRVNDDPVPRYDRGKPRLLRSGDRISIGSYSFIYLGPAEVGAFLVDQR